MSLPMPAHERFYKGTFWNVTAGPDWWWMGQRVIVVGEVFDRDEELWVRVASVSDPDEEYEACLSWLS